MSLARLVVAAVRVQGRTKSEVARDYRVSRQWVHEVIRRYDAEGEAGLEPRSRRPKGSPQQTPVEMEDWSCPAFVDGVMFPGFRGVGPFDFMPLPTDEPSSRTRSG